MQRHELQQLIGKAMAVLEKDKPGNVNIIYFIKSYPVDTVDIVGDSVMIRGRSDEEWVYISSKSEDEFLKLLESLNDRDKCYAILEDWMLAHIIRDSEMRSRLTSIRYLYEAGNVLPAVKFMAVNLKESDAPYVYENSLYKEYISIEYIRDRIKNGVALGIPENGKLAAWAITHDDGAIGFLNVLEEYRGKGYGTSVTAAAVKKLLERGEVPFLHIEEDNMKSIGLALKTGFRRDKRIHWIKLK